MPSGEAQEVLAVKHEDALAALNLVKEMQGKTQCRVEIARVLGYGVIVVSLIMVGGLLARVACENKDPLSTVGSLVGLLSLVFFGAAPLVGLSAMLSARSGQLQDVEILMTDGSWQDATFTEKIDALVKLRREHQAEMARWSIPRFKRGDGVGEIVK